MNCSRDSLGEVSLMPTLGVEKKSGEVFYAVKNIPAILVPLIEVENAQHSPVAKIPSAIFYVRHSGKTLKCLKWFT